jgi:eukaryotic-like serine/threonine-protein kinase
MSKQIAEALRVELGSAVSPGHVPAEAVGLYLRGRRKLLVGQNLGTDGAIELLEQCLQLAPDLHPALACHAIACLRAWFVPGAYLGDDVRDWEAVARAAVARAREQAPDLAETHLARAMLAVPLGEWREAIQALNRALEIAPTYAHAHQYLAHLQCETGHIKEGVERARMAYALEPGLRVAMMDVARVLALQGDRAGCERVLDTIERTGFRGPVLQLRVRVAAWYGDVATVRRIGEQLQDEAAEGFVRTLVGLAMALSGDATADEVTATLDRMIAEARNPRFFTMMAQLGTEIYAMRGEPELALSYFLRAVDSVLIDIEWIDRCPLLTAMRVLPGFAEARRKVRRRVQAMFSL